MLNPPIKHKGLSSCSACYKSRMGGFPNPNAEYDKMDKETYPINYNSPKEKQSEYDLLADLYRALGSSKATEWVKQNKFKDIDLEDVFHKIVDNETEYR